MAEPGPLYEEIATSVDGRDITEPYVGELRLPRDEVLLTRGGGDLALYERVLRNDQVFSCWQQRQRALIAREWQVEPGGTWRLDRKAADFVRAVLHHIGFDAVSAKMLSGIFYGYAVAELVYVPDGAQVAFEAVKVKRAKRFRFDRENRLRLLTVSAPLGEALPERKFWWFSTGADDDDDPYGRGLGHWLYWPVYLKRHGQRYWAVWLEKFAQPTAKGVLPRGAPEDDRRKLLAALQAIATDSAVGSCRRAWTSRCWKRRGPQGPTTTPSPPR